MPLILRPGQPTEIAAAVMAAGWAGFGGILWLGKRGAAGGSAARDKRSTLGFLLQCAAYAICFVFYRPYFSPIAPLGVFGEEGLAAISIALTLWSVWFCYAAARALGKQWALMARVIEGHELIRRGPYAVVRNPIYLAMLAMLIATGLTVSHWQALGIATGVFWVGTAIRIRTEENLLRASFGARFEEYAHAVPAFLPLKWPRRSS
jgi:protein-S-isoprenylcysteine O-methyltransferase Ste14